VLTACGLAVACGGGGGGGNDFGNGPLNITTTAVDDGVIGQAYSDTISATGGQGAKTFSVSAGALPNGLSMSASGAISGTPEGPAGTASFSVQVTDSANAPATDTQALSLTVVAAATGRNDSIANATELPGDGTYAASISPLGDPISTYGPDEDYYAITTTAASEITIDIDAEVNGSPLDSVIEVVNAAGVRLNSCDAPLYGSPCVNDDDGDTLDSRVELRVSGATTFYIHVVDWASNARPDMLYDLVITGVE
jgi:hypothetical protein